jgi:tRNA(Ile2)-agmatinylcytidine synthase
LFTNGKLGNSEFHIGIDDTDSESGGCTTYTAAVLFQELCNRGVQPSDFPWLVRLNPNIPWKTRGNGALSLHIVADDDKLDEIQEVSLSIVGRTSQLSAERADPAIVFLKGPVSPALRQYSHSALHDVLTVRRAKKIAKVAGAELHLLKGTRGVIGALAAIGADLDQTDHTFEIIAYRTRENLGSPRRVDRESIRLMSSEHGSRTFHNLDPESGRILVCPHGPDPVLLGIRGRSPNDVYEAFNRVRIDEPLERVAIFRTNQGTDAHLQETRRIIDLRRHQSTILTGRVETIPRVLRGGHVIFQLGDETGSIWCAAYAPTRSLARASRELLPGDRVRVYGGIRGVRNGMLTLNVEKIDVTELVEKVETNNPLCHSCGSRCETMGRGQGFRCKKCGLRDNSLRPMRVAEPRKLVQATYLAAVQARRHLTRPEVRNV